MNQQIVTALANKQLVILRTDTLYGILALASSKTAVERIYTLKGRQSSKPFILLLSHPAQAYDNAELLSQYAEKYHDRPTSIIVEAPSAPAYLKRGGTNLAYRVETEGTLHDIIAQTGPLVAPSANPEGSTPAADITAAQAYFGDKVDLYIDGGTVPDDVKPSRVIRINPDGSIDQLR